MNLRRTRISLDPRAKKDVGVLHVSKGLVLAQNPHGVDENPLPLYHTVVAVGRSGRLDVTPDP